METCQVELTITLYRKVVEWSKEDRIFFSAFVQGLREFGLDAALAGFNCIVEDATENAAGLIEELSFWMKNRVQYDRFVLREPIKDVLILSDI